MSRPRAVEDLGVAHRRDARHLDAPGGLAPVARPRPAGPPRPPALVERGRGQDGRLELAVALDGEQRPEQRDAADEVVGAVDRVDVPADRRVGGLAAVLLADEAVIGERVEEPAADHPLDRRCRPGSRTTCRAWSRSGGRAGNAAGRRRPPRRRRPARRPASRAARRPCRAGTRPTSPAPKRRRRTGHARILAPAGSYSGSRATSKPIQSPKTSTSPRVPMAARSGGR